MNGPGGGSPELGTHSGGVGDGIDWLDPEGGVEPVAVATVVCWRCGKAVATSLASCPHCRARLRGGGLDAAIDPAVSASTGAETAIGRLLILYVAFLATSVIYGMTIDFSIVRKAPPTDEEVQRRLVELMVVEAVDTVLVIVGIAWTRRPAPPPPVGSRRRLLAWLAAPAALAALLAANFAYFRLLRDALGIPVLDPEFAHRPELIPWAVAGLCVQPAIVEELFFRYLAIGHLREVVGAHGAVWIAAVMFGMAHLFNPLGIPYLILAGAVFGYARVHGRSLAIPILMHFAHNAIVIWSEPWL